MGTENSKAEPAADAASEAHEGEGQEGQIPITQKGAPAGTGVAAPDSSQQAQKQDENPPTLASAISPSTQLDTLSHQGDGQVSTHPSQVHSESTDNTQCEPEQNNKSLSGHSGEQKDFNSSQQEQGAEGLNTSASSTHSLTSALKQGLSLAGFTLFAGKTDHNKMETDGNNEHLAKDNDLFDQDHIERKGIVVSKASGNKTYTGTDKEKDSEGNVLQSDVHPLNSDNVAVTGGASHVEIPEDVNSNKLGGQVLHELTSHGSDTAQLTSDMATLQLSNQTDIPQFTSESELPKTVVEGSETLIKMDTAESPRISQAWSDSGGEEEDFFDAADMSPTSYSKEQPGFVTESQEGNDNTHEGVISGSKDFGGDSGMQSVEAVSTSSHEDSMQSRLQVISDVTNDQTPVQTVSNVTNDQALSNTVDLSTPVNTNHDSETSNIPDLSDSSTTDAGIHDGSCVDHITDPDPSKASEAETSDSPIQPHIANEEDRSAEGSADPAVNQSDPPSITDPALLATTASKNDIDTCDRIADSQLSNVNDESSVADCSVPLSKDGIQSGSIVHNAATSPTQSKSYIAHVDSGQQQKVLNKDHCSVTQPRNSQQGNVNTQEQTLNPNISQDVADLLMSDKESPSSLDDQRNTGGSLSEGADSNDININQNVEGITYDKLPRGTGVIDINMNGNSVTKGNKLIQQENLPSISTEHIESSIKNTKIISDAGSNVKVNNLGNDNDDKINDEVPQRMSDTSSQQNQSDIQEDNDISVAKGAYNLDFLDDPNFNPFQTQNKLGGDSKQELPEGNATGKTDGKSYRDNSNDDGGSVLSESKQSVNMTCNNSESTVETPVTCGSKMQSDVGPTEQPDQSTAENSGFSHDPYVGSDNQQSVKSIPTKENDQSTLGKADNSELLPSNELDHSQEFPAILDNQQNLSRTQNESDKPVQSASDKIDSSQVSDVNTQNQQTVKSAERKSDIKVEQKGTSDVNVSENICEGSDRSEVLNQVEQSQSLDEPRNISEEVDSSVSTDLQGIAESKQSADNQVAVQDSEQADKQGASSGNMRDQSGTAVSATISSGPAESNPLNPPSELIPEDLSATCAAQDAANRQEIISADISSNTQSPPAGDSDNNTAAPPVEEESVTEKTEVTQQPAEPDIKQEDNGEVGNEFNPKRVSRMEETVSLVTVTTSDKTDDPDTSHLGNEVNDDNVSTKAALGDRLVTAVTDQQEDKDDALHSDDQGQSQINPKQSELADVIGTNPSNTSELCHTDQDTSKGNGMTATGPDTSQLTQDINTGNDQQNKEAKVSDGTIIIGSTVLPNDNSNNESQTDGKSQLDSSAIITEKSVDNDVLHNVLEHKKDTQGSCDANQNNVINKDSCDKTESDVIRKDMVLLDKRQTEETTGEGTQGNRDTKDMVLTDASLPTENIGNLDNSGMETDTAKFNKDEFKRNPEMTNDSEVNTFFNLHPGLWGLFSPQRYVTVNHFNISCTLSIIF